MELERVIIVHGYLASPAEHWFGWLRSELEKQGVAVEIPALPTPDAPETLAWRLAILAALGSPDERTAVVAHSLGAVAALEALSTLPEGWRLGAFVGVSAFDEPIPALPQLDGFTAVPLPHAALRAAIARRAVLHSDDDTIVPPTASAAFAERFGASVELVPGAGHFLGADGHTELPAALRALPSS